MDENFAMGYAMGQDNGNNNCNGNGLFGGNDGWLGILLLIALLGGGLGYGGFGGFGGGAGLQGMATRADINEGFALNNITSGITAIQQGICDATYALNNAITAGFHGVDRAVCDIGYAIKDCCCTTQRAIDGVNYNMATQTNALQTAMCTNTRDIIDSQQAGTRAILDFLTQDKISTLTAENQALRFQASQAQQNAFITANQDAQTAELIRRLGRDCPVPAYVVPNPNCCYGNPVGVGYNGYGNGCGCTCA